MKKYLSITLLLGVLFFSACDDKSYDDLDAEYNSDPTALTGTGDFDNPTNSSISVNERLSLQLASTRTYTLKYVATATENMRVRISWTSPTSITTYMNLKVYENSSSSTIGSNSNYYDSDFTKEVVFSAVIGNTYTFEIEGDENSDIDYSFELYSAQNLGDMQEITSNKTFFNTLNQNTNFYNAYSMLATKSETVGIKANWTNSSSLGNANIQMKVYENGVYLSALSRYYSSDNFFITYNSINLTEGNTYTFLMIADDTYSKDIDYALEISSSTANSDTINLVPNNTHLDILNQKEDLYDVYTYTPTHNELINLSLFWDVTDTSLKLYLYENGSYKESKDEYYDTDNYWNYTTELLKDMTYTMVISSEDTNDVNLSYAIELTTSSNNINKIDLNESVSYEDSVNQLTDIYDVYSFTALKDANTLFSLNWKDQSYDTNLELMIYEDDVKIISKDNYYNSDNYTNYEHTVQEGSLYTVMVRSNNTLDKNLSYVLNVSPGYISAATDTLLFDQNQTKILNSITNSIDSYTFDIETSQRVRLDLIWNGHIFEDPRFYLHLYEDGLEVVESTNYYNSDKFSYIEYNAIAGKVYTVNVRAHETLEEDNRYTLSLTSK